MNYEEAIAYIEEIPKFTTKNKLSHTKECLQRLGNPESTFDVIHVAGSNGKGSVCAFLASVLQEGEKKVGLFTSPHLIRHNERFMIGGQEVSDHTFLDAFGQVLKLSKQLLEEGSYHPTYFEFLFLMGMVIFASEGVEIAVLETGLGGRLDATNAVEHPLACVITSISLEHTEYLGDTLEEIAWEKAGIIQPKAVVVYEGLQDSVSAVIEKQAKEIGNEVICLKKGMYEIYENSTSSIDFSLQNGYYDNTVITIPFAAPYQVINASLALLTLNGIRDKYPMDIETIRSGMKKTKWPGRMEHVLPGVILDGAHNEDGIRRFVETVAGHHNESPITLLFSAVVDKDYPAMIQKICGSLKLSSVVTTQIDGDRVVPAKELADLFQQNGCAKVTAVENIENAFDLACEQKGEGLLFCVGSLYLVGELKSYIRRCTND